MRGVEVNTFILCAVSIGLASCASTSGQSFHLSAEDKAVDLVMGSLTKDEAVDCSLTMTIVKKLQEGGVVSSNVESGYFSKSSRAFVTRMTNAVEKEEGLTGLLGIMSKEGEFLKTPFTTRLENEADLPAKTELLRSKFESCEPFSSKYLGNDHVQVNWSNAKASI